MIYAPIKYKKVNVSSPLYLQCLSYSVAPASVKTRYVANENNINKKDEAFSFKAKKSEIKPICKQSAREKIKELGTSFSQKFDALFGEKLNATKEKARAVLGKDMSDEKLHKPEKESSYTKKFKAKFEDFFSRDKETEEEKSESAFAKFKAKVKNMLNKNDSKNQTNAMPASAVEDMEAEFVELDETLKQMALGVLPTRYDNVKPDKTLAIIAQNIQEEQAKKEFEEIDETLVAMSKSAKKEKALEIKEAIRLANEGGVKPNVDSQTTSEVEDDNVAEVTPASVLDDVVNISESSSEQNQAKTEDTLTQKLGRTVSKIKDFFALKGNNNAVEEVQKPTEKTNAESVDKNNELMHADTPASRIETNVETQENDAIKIKENEAKTDNSTEKNAKIIRQVACETEEKTTYKRKSYYALKVENAKKHLINAGIRIKCVAKRFVYFFKDKFTAPEFVEYEDKDDYRKYGMKETRIATYPENATPAETATTTTTTAVKSSTQTNKKTFRATTLDNFFDL